MLLLSRCDVSSLTWVMLRQGPACCPACCCCTVIELCEPVSVLLTLSSWGSSSGESGLVKASSIITCVATMNSAECQGRPIQALAQVHTMPCRTAYNIMMMVSKAC